MKSSLSCRVPGWLVSIAVAGTIHAAPVGNWAFDETSGATAADSSGNGLDFTLSGTPAWTAGHSGNALGFDGLTTYGSVADSPLLDGTDKLTISFWVKPTGLDGNSQFVVSKRTAQLQNTSYAMFFGAGNKLNVDINYHAGLGNRFQSQTVFENDQWYHVVLVFDGAAHVSQRARLYVNGSLDRDARLNTTFIPDYPSPLYIGIGHPGYAHKFKGLIDELSIRRELPDGPEGAALHQGYWTLEKWTNMPYKDTGDLLMDPRYFLQPNIKEVISEAGKNLGWYQSGGRFRGHIEVPADGKYVFWISARTAADLYLSEDGQPFAKRRIARMSPKAGTGDGIRSNDTNLWDQYTSQMSVPIELEAGTKYYIESIAQVSLGDLSHVRLAWAPENGTRSEIPASALSYYIIPQEDLDDDSLPDAWETLKGLDPSDNGAIDSANQGERGDYDRDGLTNREEYLLGTDPRSADSDNDGRSDYDEIHTYRSNPLESNSPSETVVGSVNIHQFTSPLQWMDLDGGLVAESFRGEISWNFSVPNDGVWLLQASTRLRGDPKASEQVDVNVFIDGRPLGRHTISYGGSHQAFLRIVTPFLATGSHTLKFEIDNTIARRTVQIAGIDVLEPSGDDLDENGIIDWVETLLAQTDRVIPHGTSSITSPFFLEGRSRLVSEVKVNGNSVAEGVDQSHWFTNIALSPSAATSYSVAYASGISSIGEVNWQATNVLDGGSLTVRNGDSLKLGAWIPDGTGSATIAVKHGIPSLPSAVSSGLAGETTDVAEGTGSLRIPATGGQHVRLTDSDELDGTNRLVISFRAKPDASSLDGVPRGIVSKRTGTNSNVAFSVFTFTGGRLFVDLDVGTSTPLRVDTGYTMTSAWQQVTIDFDGSLAASERLKVYVDGTLRKTASVSATSIRNMPSNLVVGTLNANYASGGVIVGFGGLIDDLSVSRAVPATDSTTTVRLLFNAPAALGTQKNSISTVHAVSGIDSFIGTFSTAHGPYEVSAGHGSGPSGLLTVHVPKADLPPVSVLENTLRYWTLAKADVDPSLVFQAGEGLSLGAREDVDASTFRHTLYPSRGGNFGIAARLWEDGPIAGICRVSSVGLTGALDGNRISSGNQYLDGYRVIVTPVVVTDLPPEGWIKISIFRAGLYFEDGSTVKIFTADDLQDGILLLRYLMEENLNAGFCHYIDIYDAQGTLLGRR